MSKKKVSRFTSSQIYKLCSWNRGKTAVGSPYKTYVHEKRLERKLGRRLDTFTANRATIWGNVMELVAFDYMGLEYKYVAHEVVEHYDEEFTQYWAGITDFLVEDEKVSELKCYYPKGFAEYTETILAQDVDLLRKNHPMEYWQIVSNSILYQTTRGEAVSFMPKNKMYREIRELAETMAERSETPWLFRFIWEGNTKELPFMPDDSDYESLNKFEFDIPIEDIEFLTERVKMAIEDVNQ